MPISTYCTAAQRPQMAESPEKLLREALQLTPVDRAALVDELLSSLDQPDERIDALWAQEAEEEL